MFFITATSASALLLAPFTSWDDLVERSPDIIIARCIATEDLLEPPPTSIYPNVFNSDIQVISVLKGNSMPGMSHLVSTYFPYRGEYFAAFATYSTVRTNSVYVATEEYRIVPLIHFHGAGEFAGKTLNQQIQLILKERLIYLNDELAKGNEEKKRLEEGLKTPIEVTTNSPPVFLKTAP